ncbi:MAG TPA: hypothetical protein VFM46_18220 [Pseudomonadales bacterium]|nr:hypothetical protein [Pseudomonadales bacterium]
MIQNWRPLTVKGNYDYDAQNLKENWGRLHACESEPFPSPDYLKALLENNERAKKSIPGFDGDYGALSDKLLAGWRAFHKGDFRGAYETGVSLGYAGAFLADVVSVVYASNIHADKEEIKKIFLDSAQRSLEASKLFPQHVNSLYFYGLNLGRYSETVSLIKALAENIAPKFQQALNETLRKNPSHVLANLGFGTFNASIIDMVGAIVGKVTYGVSRDKAIQHYETALRAAPFVPVAYIEYGKGLAMMDGKKGVAKAQSLYEKGAKLTPMDAMEELDVAVCARGIKA